MDPVALTRIDRPGYDKEAGSSSAFYSHGLCMPSPPLFAYNDHWADGEFMQGSVAAAALPWR